MPSLQVVDLGDQGYKKRKGIGGFMDEVQDAYKGHQERSAIDEILGEYKQNMGEAQAYEKAQLDLMQDNRIGPTKRLEIQSQLDQVQKTVIEKDKALNARFKSAVKSDKDREEAIQLQEDRGMPRYEAEAYVDGSKGVQAQIERAHQELVSRNLRQPRGPKQPTQQMGQQGEQPIQDNMPSQPNEPSDIPPKNIPTPEEWPEMKTPEGMTNAEKIKWENDNQKANNKELAVTQTKKKAYQNNAILIDSMQKSSPYLPNGINKMVLIDPETGDVRPTAQLAEQMNPQTELYIKNLKQFLKGAKDFFGARVTNFDVGAFMAQLPTLMNSEDGRNLILKQMELVNDLESDYNNTLNEGLKKYSRSGNYADILSTVDKKVESSQAGKIKEINDLASASAFMGQMAQNPEMFKDRVLVQDSDGNFKAIKKDDLSKLPEGWRKF